ncbi:MAG: hypothetical protein QG654_443 [Patescibacteria group bacterium]|nr:hypothetical protein [Patescibacteria group bacterium]
MQTLVIIFGISLIGIVVMIYRGVSHVRALGLEHGDITHPMGKHINTFWEKIKIIINYIAHSFAIIVSRIWARISHRISMIYKNIVNKIEDYFRHKNENNLNKELKTQSILLTTIKAYKKEIKKLKQKIDPDQMKPKDEIKAE